MIPKQTPKNIGIEPFNWLNRIGNRLDGDIASAKKLISARALMFSDFFNEEKPPILLDYYDRLALGGNNLLPNVATISASIKPMPPSYWAIPMRNFFFKKEGKISI